MTYIMNRVFKPDLRPKSQVLPGLLGFDRVTRSTFIFLNQNNIILIKQINNQRVKSGFCKVIESTRRVSQVFDFAYCFLNSTRFQS